jgi:hypothetical protein
MRVVRINSPIEGSRVNPLILAPILHTNYKQTTLLSKSKVINIEAL